MMLTPAGRDVHYELMTGAKDEVKDLAQDMYDAHHSIQTGLESANK
jgi:hypothetical protein